ncbi:ryanodine-inositol 1,4,5-triphosphate receptor Ca2 channel (RIR-CaC) family protein [Phytophthora cinnamomi]|uniref:ryanodine-inositol 1,4,5-triphosphate receptor Ca2 channel (RIR-CaC) family protein n=2 Tax=Phytophthora cinnamomi TaxID=4785 RepID=UPI00355A6C25|nr:ryanodine-inositol 1,4,5-triphosphate receptor Ca2 channel (RIR-CaC) family protein [Phytophthora cinnamomi]
MQLQDQPADESAVLLEASYALMEDAAGHPTGSRASKSELLAVHGDYAQDAGDSKRECRWWTCCWWRRAHHAAEKSLGVEASEERSASRMSVSTRPKTHDQLVAARQLKQQIAHYSTMRVHMKRVQLCLEQEKRNKFYKELVVYLCFLGVIMAALLTLPVHFPYEQNSALDNTYFQEQLPNTTYAKSFYDVGNEGEMWQWASGPMLYQFYEPPIRNSRAIGSILMRTGQVKGALCSQTTSRSDFVMFTDEVCYPEYSASSEMKEAYGNDSGVLRAQYQWTSGLSKLLRSETFKPGLVSREMDYGHGGYVVYLPRDNYTAATALVTQLQSDFIQDGTRYMASTFAFYNARSNIFSHVQGLFEMSNTDYMQVTGRIKSFRMLASYRDTGDFLEANALVIVLVIATALLVYREISDVRNYGLRKYVQSLWNLLDMLQLVLLAVFITHWVQFIVRSENLRDDLYRVGDMDCSGPAHDQEMARECFVDIESLAWLSRSVTNYAAALGLVSVAIVFKYLRLNSRLNLLWRTLRFAAKDLLAFVIIFFTIFFGFAVMGFLTFGTAVQQYHSLSVSLTSCFQMLLGAFDYEEIYVANPTMAAIFFFSFMISIYLICVNMFIAIMSEYYSLAQNEKKTLEENKRNLAVATKDGDEDDEDFRDSLQFMDVEYDLAKQTKNYINGLRVRVKMPPVKDASSLYNTEQLVLCGFQRVLLVDYDYLMAERKRLRRKFRACVHLIMVCGDLMRQNDPDFTMHVEMEFVNELARPRADSTDSFADLVEFPVTYVPISSSLANTVEILKRLKPGMSIEIDDGSLTKDQITLEVLGDQDEYVPSRFKRRHPTGDQSDDYDGSSNADVFRVRISENTSTTDMYGSSRSGEGPFGLRHNHPNIGGANHIRACRVLYNGNALLDGNEMCIMPRSTWFRYFTGYVGWGYIKRLLSCKRKKKKTHRLVTDADVDRLINESFAAPGRGISCRFDELVRNFRMFIAKKVHKRRLRIPNLEDRIFQEVITFLERFPSALTPLDKRELEGYKYTPQPVDTRRIRLPHSINLLAELLSQNAHEVWAVGRINQGWRWGTQRDNDKKLHPDLVPYEALTEQDKQYDRDTSMSALKVITALGYVLEPPSSNEEQFDGFEFGTEATEPGGTYEPKPIPTDDVKVPPHLRSVIELLAENTHEVWAQMRMEQGWKFGPRRNDAKKEHNGLVPYIYLTQDEKQMDRNTAMQTVKLILRFGFNFVHKDQRTRGGKKKHSGHIKVVGRNDNAEAHNVSEAVSLARSTTRAKRAFLGRSGRPFSSIRSGSTNSLFSMNSTGSDNAASQESQQQRVAEAHARLIAATSSSAITTESSGDIAMPLASFQSMNSADSFDSPKDGDSSNNTKQ